MDYYTSSLKRITGCGSNNNNNNNIDNVSDGGALSKLAAAGLKNKFLCSAGRGKMSEGWSGSIIIE